jgi:hypothetical protein
MVGEDVDERERVVRVLIGEDRVEDMHNEGNLQDSLLELQDCPPAQVVKTHILLKNEPHTT